MCGDEVDYFSERTVDQFALQKVLWKLWSGSTSTSLVLERLPLAA